MEVESGLHLIIRASGLRRPIAMFILDSLMISGIRWALETVVKAAEAEMNDDTALREQLLEAEMRREMGEISDEEFEEIEADLLGRIREIKERREGAGPLSMGGAQPMETTADTTFQVEASVSGDFHSPIEGATAHVVDVQPVHEPLAPGHLIDAHGVERIAVIDQAPPRRSTRSKPSTRSTRSGGSNVRTVRTPRTPRTK